MLDAFQATLEALKLGLHVGHVATPLIVAYPNQTVKEVRGWAEPAGINNVPVRVGNRIVGVVENLNGDLAPAEGDWPPPAPDDDERIGSAKRDLASDMLIDASHPLVDLIDELLMPPHYRLVFRDRALPAIVTPSDLTKLPMRVLVYTRIAHLEATMLDAIRARFDEHDAVCKLDLGAQSQIDDELSKLHGRHLDPGFLEVTTLKQKAQILTAARAFSGDTVHVLSELDDLYERLRNPLVHAASYVDDSLTALRWLKQQLEVIEERTSEAHAFLRPNS